MANVTIDLAKLVADAQPGTVIQLTPGTYDSDEPIILERRVTIAGPRAAVVHAEFQVCATNARLAGFTLEMNKAGAEQHTGLGAPYPQNALVVVNNGSLWIDDVAVQTVAGLNKSALQVIHGILHVRAVTEYAKIDWRGNPARVIDLLYGSYANIFGTGGDVVVGVSSGTAAEQGATLALTGSKCTLSGAHLFNFGTAIYGASVARDSYLQVGAGYYTSFQNYVTSVLLDGESEAEVTHGDGTRSQRSSTGSHKWIGVGNLAP